MCNIKRRCCYNIWAKLKCISQHSDRLVSKKHPRWTTGSGQQQGRISSCDESNHVSLKWWSCNQLTPSLLYADEFCVRVLWIILFYWTLSTVNNPLRVVGTEIFSTQKHQCNFELQKNSKQFFSSSFLLVRFSHQDNIHSITDSNNKKRPVFVAEKKHTKTLKCTMSPWSYTQESSSKKKPAIY